MQRADEEILEVRLFPSGPHGAKEPVVRVTGRLSRARRQRKLAVGIAYRRRNERGEPCVGGLLGTEMVAESADQRDERAHIARLGESNRCAIGHASNDTQRPSRRIGFRYIQWVVIAETRMGSRRHR